MIAWWWDLTLKRIYLEFYRNSKLSREHCRTALLSFMTKLNSMTIKSICTRFLFEKIQWHRVKRHIKEKVTSWLSPLNIFFCQSKPQAKSTAPACYALSSTSVSSLTEQLPSSCCRQNDHQQIQQSNQKLEKIFNLKTISILRIAWTSISLKQS